LTVLLLLMQLSLQAQVYPVQVVPQLLPPYTLNFSDYYQGTQEKLVVLLTNTDLTKPALQVRLKMSIQGQSANFKSRDGVYYPPITLDGGAPQRITLADLAPYFNLDNLDVAGVTRSQFQQNQKLPEGFYQFCFEAYEYNTNRLVGRSNCAMAWISLQEPPLLNLPVKGESIAYKDPTNIIFQWTPRNMGSPTSAFNTEYEFTLVELWDNGIAPEAAFGSTQPLYRTTTQATTLLYGPSEPLLIPGKRYGWRIRAQASDGSQNTDTYRNNGYSEIFWFTYQRDCPMPFNIQSEISSGRVTITWNAALQQTRFTVDYREKGQTNNQWYTVNSSTNRAMLYDLKKDKQYEYRVGAFCDAGSGAFPANGAVYSDIKNFYLDGSSADAEGGGCNILQPDLQVANRNPIQTLLSGEVIMAGDFPVKLITVQGQSNFSGTGYITIPFIGKVAVKVRFSGITVNTDKQLIGGIIETTYDAKESQIADLDKAIDGGGNVGMVVRGVDTAGYYVDMVIPDAKNIDVDLTTKVDSAGNTVPTGGATLKVTGNDGAVKEVAVEKLPATIKDKNGTIYSIDKDGHVTKLASSEPMNMTASELNTLQNNKAVVTFIPHEKQQYAFDEYQPVYSRSNLFKAEYEKLNGDYYVSSKAIVEAKSDVIKAVVEIKDNSIIADSIRFVTGKGTRYESTRMGDNTYEIKIVGGPAADAQELYALYPKGGGKYLSLGKLLIASYPERTFKLVLVPVNGAPVNKEAISQQLDAIYKPVGISLQVTQDESFNDKTWDLNHDDKLAVSGSGWLSTQTDEMKALNSAYTGAHTVQQDAVYLFVLNSSDSTLTGDMPRGKQFGYLFTGADGKTAAHEIGHGLFNLKHAFDNDYGFKQGELSSNVMDYPNGDRFTKYQWNQLYKPGIVIGLFEKEGDAQSLGEPYLKCINDDKVAAGLGKLFYDPVGQVVQLDDDMTPYAFFGSKEGEIYGNLAAFKKKGKTYIYLLYAGGKNSGDYGGVFGSIDGSTQLETLKIVRATAKQVKIGEDNKLDGTRLAGCSCNTLTKIIEPGNEVKIEDKQTGKVNKKGAPVTKEEFQICNSDPFNQEHLFLVQMADGTKTWGQKIVKQLNYLVEGNKKNKFGDDILKAKLDGVSYISTGSNYKGDPVFQGGFTLEELNNKMAYLEISKGYQFYTRFIETSCTFPQQVADKFAKDILDSSNVNKQKGIICLVLYNNKATQNDPQQYTIGLAFGSNVGEATGIRAILNTTGGNVLKNIVGKLIEAYRSVPKKRIVYSYFITKPTGQQIADRSALITADKPYPELRGVLKKQVDKVDNEPGNAIEAEYSIANEPSSECKIIDVDKTLKEEYVVDESANLALNYAVKYAGWNLNSWDGSKARADKIIHNGEPVVTACHFTLGKPCLDVMIDNAFFVATLVTPQRYMFIPVTAAVVYYGSKDQWDEATAYLLAYGLSEVALPALTAAVSKSYSLIKLGAKQLKDLRIALEFKLMVNKGLTDDAIKLLYNKQVGNYCAEYLIPYTKTKNLFVKIESAANNKIEKILVGSVEGDVLVVRGYQENTTYIVESIDEVRLKEIAEDITEYAKKIINGKEYLKIGAHFYSPEAIAVMVKAENGISPNLVEGILKTEQEIKNGAISYFDNFDVIVEAEGNSVIHNIHKIENRSAPKAKMGLQNSYMATDIEIQVAAARIKAIRGTQEGRNIAYLKGQVNGKKISEKEWWSGAADLTKEPQSFEAIEVAGKDGVPFLRNVCSEYKSLSQLAADLEPLGPGLEGELKIISEAAFCKSCRLVIKQLNETYPKLKLILVNGIK
jgi:TANFOR domain-containing protein